MCLPMSNSVQEGLERRSGLVTPAKPVRGHVHKNPHWLICTGAEGSGMLVKTQTRGNRIMVADDDMCIPANDIHSISVEHGWATYKCVGVAPL